MAMHYGQIMKTRAKEAIEKLEKFEMQNDDSGTVIPFPKTQKVGR